MGFQESNEGMNYNSQLDIHPALNLIFTDETTKLSWPSFLTSSKDMLKTYRDIK